MIADEQTTNVRLGRRLVYWDGLATRIALGLAAVAVVTLALRSEPSLEVLTVLGTLAISALVTVAWVVLVVKSLIDRQVRVPVLVAPLVIAVLWTACYTDLAAQTRFALSRPAMNHFAATLPPPVIAPDRELTSRESERYSDAPFPATCPRMLGSYPVRQCRVTPDGYAFLARPEGDNSYADGIVYSPQGQPNHPFGSSDLQSTFEPLGGPWYSFFQTW